MLQVLILDGDDDLLSHESDDEILLRLMVYGVLILIQEYRAKNKIFYIIGCFLLQIIYVYLHYI